MPEHVTPLPSTRPTSDHMIEWSFPPTDPPPAWAWDIDRDSTSDATPVRAVLGYDGSPPSLRALERAATLAGRQGRVIVVVASPPGGPAPDSILDAPTTSEQSNLLQTSAALLRARGTNATFVASRSNPAEALIQAARDGHAHVIVVGQTGTGYVTRALLGSTAENLIRCAPCDVLVIA